jgi:hypothetical protein
MTSHEASINFLRTPTVLLLANLSLTDHLLLGLESGGSSPGVPEGLFFNCTEERITVFRCLRGTCKWLGSAPTPLAAPATLAVQLDYSFVNLTAQGQPLLQLMHSLFVLDLVEPTGQMRLSLSLGSSKARLLLGTLNVSEALPQNTTPSMLYPLPMFPEVTRRPPFFGSQAVNMSTGILDVTQPPFNADPTGQRDATVPLQRAVDIAFRFNLVVFLPLGDYMLTDTLELNQNSSGSGQNKR